MSAKPRKPPIDELARMVAPHFEAWAENVIGDEPTSKRKGEVRFGSRGSMKVSRAGFYDHQDGVGGDMLDLHVHVRGGTLAEAYRHGLAWLGLDAGRSGPMPQRVAAAAAPEPARKPNTDLLRRLWCEAVPAAGTLAERYLGSRGLRLPAGAPIRFHPACPRGAERLPAMLAIMSDPATGQACGIHRTFTRSDGTSKADGLAKAMLGQAGIIRLVPDAEVTAGLGLAEGIETALAIMQRAGWSPVWAAGSAGGIARFPVLAGVEALTIFPDADDSGASIKAAGTCAERWTSAGREVRIILPPAGTDWHDAAACPAVAA